MAVARSGPFYAALRQARNRVVLTLRRLRAVDPTAYVHPTASVARDLHAEEYVFIGRSCSVPATVSIGRYSMLAAHVAIVGDDHNWDQPGVPMQFSGRPEQRSTRIGRDVWIGRGAIVIRGVRIGDGSIVAAGSVVTKDVPPLEVWAGVPARRIRSRFPDEQENAEHRAALGGALLRPRFAERRRPPARPTPQHRGTGRSHDPDRVGRATP